MPDVAEILTALRAAHPPLPPLGLTAGDILLPSAFGLLAALILSLVWPTRIKGRRRIALTAIEELKAARSLSPDEARVAQARLLRRLVREADGDAAATLDGPAFADHLDRRFATDFFTSGAGRTLTVSLYAPGAPGEDVGAVLESLLDKMKA